MKTIVLFTAFFVQLFVITNFNTDVLFNNSITCSIQETQVVEAVFDSHEDYGYNFIQTKDSEEHTITFQEIDDAVLAMFDLNEAILIGTKFKITFTAKVFVTKDSDGYEDENELNTIKKLEKL
ncbi:MAG: hypothetical protein NWQ07_05755 [Flaviramulus sp.]|nr:hypothetical protein [Flaviramulus sp.]